MKPPQIIIFLSFLLCSASLCKAQSAGTFSGLRLQASSTWADNLNRSSHIPSVKSGQFYTASGTLDYSRQLNRNWIIIAEGEVVTNIVKKYSGLNSLSGTGKAKIRRKFGLGAYAPIFEASVGATVSSFKETARNGTQLEAGLRVSKRLTHALQFSGGINWEDFNARHRTYDVRMLRTAGVSVRELLAFGDNSSPVQRARSGHSHSTANWDRKSFSTTTPWLGRYLIPSVLVGSRIAIVKAK